MELEKMYGDLGISKEVLEYGPESKRLWKTVSQRSMAMQSTIS